MTKYAVNKEIDEQGVEYLEDGERDKFYTPDKIVFNRACITNFILPHLIELEKGQYPLPPSVTGYTDAEYKAYVVTTHANYELACSIAAEINYRISQVPRGRILIDRYTFNKSYNELSKIYKMMESDVWSFIKPRLYYVSGKRRKNTPWNLYYNVWKYQGNYKNAIKISV